MAVSTIALYSCDPAIPLTIPVVYIQQISGQVHQLLFSRMVIAAWFYNSFRQEISPMSITSRMDKQVNMCSRILYNNVKKKKKEKNYSYPHKSEQKEAKNKYTWISM